MVGRTISHYQILEKLGEGGMGVVYKARDTQLERLVALKFLHSSEDVPRLLREAKVGASLNHLNICTVHEVNPEHGFIAMELVEGQPLSARLAAGALPVEEVLRFGLQLTDALAKAHAAGIVHRDLKPGNVMVGEDGRVKVLDFGLAKLTEAAPLGEEGSTRTMRPTTEEGKVVGTVSYMSPEQAEGKKVDARSDIFSFGAVLHEVVTGCRAFQGETRASTLAAVLKDEPKPASQVAVGLPREVDRLIRRRLHKDPAHRVQHMDDLGVALEAVRCRRSWKCRSKSWRAVRCSSVKAPALSPVPAVCAADRPKSRGGSPFPCYNPRG